MASPSKCPNPGCPFLFDPAQVPPGAVIACPRCGLRFSLAPMPPAHPGAATDPGSAFRDDPFAPSEESDTDARDEDSPSLYSRGKKRPRHGDDLPKKRKRSSGLLKSIVIAAVAVTAIASLPLGFVALRLYNKRTQEVQETTTDLKYPDLNLQFKKPTPESGWVKHDGTRTSFNAALFGYQRGDENAPTAWIVGDARKLGYAVRPSDLRDRTMDQLNANFDNVSESDEAKEDTLCGLPASRTQFRATHKKTGENVTLEVFALANKSIGVWIFAWSPEREFANNQSAFQSIRAGLQIVKTDDPNVEVAAATKTHRSKSGLFTIKDADGLWVKKDTPADLDPDGTLWLKGTPKSAGGKNKPTSVDLVVVEVAPDGEAKDQAMTIVKRSLPEGDPTIEELTGDPTGEPSSGEVNPSAAITRLKIRYKGADSSVHKLAVFTSVESGDKRIIAYATCQLKDLPYWEQRLMQIVGSLAPRTK